MKHNFKMLYSRGQFTGVCLIILTDNAVAADHYYVAATCTYKVPALSFSHYSIIPFVIRYYAVNRPSLNQLIEFFCK